MPYLPWIKDNKILNCVNELLSIAAKARKEVENNFGKNVIDPFSALFEIGGFDLSYDTWHKSETTRQAQKTLQNHIGNFHQKILGACDGWEDMKTGGVIDLVCNERKIIAEIKNKYNTISGGKLADLYYNLENLVMPKASTYKDYTAYYVYIIPSSTTTINKEFVPSDKEKGQKCPSNKLIREIDGKSFYALVTGYPNALASLFSVLPEIIATNGTKKFTEDEKNILKKFFQQAYSE